MEIKIIGASEMRRGYILAVSTYLVKVLKLRKSRIDVNIYCIPHLSKEHKKRGAVARMSDDRINMLLDSRLDAKSLIQVMAHEFVHVKQHARGQLKPYTRKNGTYGWYWMGKINRSKYANQPWEIEAERREKILGNKLIDLLNTD